MNLLREYIRILLTESTKDPDLGMFSNEISNKIMSVLGDSSVIDRLKEQSAESEVTTIIDTGALFTNYDTINDVHLGIAVNDQGYGRVKAYYLCVPEDRSQSNLVIEVDIPRGYSQVDEFNEWMEVELADALSHELQHSCDPTEMLTADIPEGEAKWESLENIYKHFGSEAETRGNVAGIMSRAKRSGRDPLDILDDKMDEIFNEALSNGFNEDEITPVIQKIYAMWKGYMQSLS